MRDLIVAALRRYRGFTLVVLALMTVMAWGVLLAAVIVWHVDVGVVGLIRVAVVIAALGFGLFCLQEWPKRGDR